MSAFAKPAPGTLTSGTLAASLVGYWLMNDGLTPDATTPCADATGLGNTGTTNGMQVGGIGVGMTWGTSPDATVISGQCLSGFTGGNATLTWVDVGNSNSLNPTSAFTYEAWIYPTTRAVGSQWVIGRDDASLGRSYAFGFDNSNDMVLQINGTGVISTVGTGAGVITVNQWNHLLATGSAASGHIYGYVNGVLIATAASFTAPATSTAETNIGRRSYAANQNGVVGTVGIASIRNALLLQADVTNLYTTPGIVFPSGTSITTLRLIQGNYVTQNTFRRLNAVAPPLFFDLVLSSDHVSPATGLSPTVTLLKPGASSFTVPAGTVTEVGNGRYQVGGAGLATDLNTPGLLTLSATAATADICKVEFVVS